MRGSDQSAHKAHTAFHGHERKRDDEPLDTLPDTPNQDPYI